MKRGRESGGERERKMWLKFSTMDSNHRTRWERERMRRERKRDIENHSRAIRSTQKFSIHHIVQRRWYVFHTHSLTKGGPLVNNFQIIELEHWVKNTHTRLVPSTGHDHRRQPSSTLTIVSLSLSLCRWHFLTTNDRFFQVPIHVRFINVRYWYHWVRFFLSLSRR